MRVALMFFTFFAVALGCSSFSFTGFGGVSRRIKKEWVLGVGKNPLRLLVTWRVALFDLTSPSFSLAKFKFAGLWRLRLKCADG